MFARHSRIPRTRLSSIIRCVASIAVVMLLAAMAIGVNAQGTFDSGSTGADGAFNPPHNFVLQIPESGVLNFTTITKYLSKSFSVQRNSFGQLITGSEAV